MDFTFGFFQNLRSSCLNIQQHFDKLELKKIIQSKNLFQNAKIRSFFYKTNRTNNFFLVALLSDSINFYTPYFVVTS